MTLWLYNAFVGVATRITCPVHHQVYTEAVEVLSILLQIHRLKDVWLYDRDSAKQAWQARV